MELNNIPDFDFDIVVDDVAQTEPQDNVIVNKEGQDTVEVTPEEGAEKVYGDTADKNAVFLFNEMKGRGIFDDQDEKDFDGSFEKLDEAIGTLPQRVLNSIIAEAPDVTKQLFRFAFADTSKELTSDDLKGFMKQYLEDIAEVETPQIETMDGARSFLETIYKERGMKPNAVKAVLNTLEDDDELLVEAKAELDKQSSEKAAGKSEKLIAERENDRIQREARQREFVQKVHTELNQTGWKSERIKTVEKLFSQNAINTVLSNVASNPKALVKLADFLGYYDHKTGDIDYTRFVESSQTKEVKDFKARAEEAMNFTPSTGRNISINPNQKRLEDANPIVEVID